MSSWQPIRISFEITRPSTNHDNSLPPVILLHGMMTNCEDWNDIDQAVADATHRMVYKLDARNHGNSEWSDVFDIDVLVKDVKYFIDQNNIRKAVIVGHSMGGKTAMEFAVNYPEMVEKLIVEDMTPQEWKKPAVEMAHGMLQLYEHCFNSISLEYDLEKGKRYVVDLILSKMPEGTCTERTKEVAEVVIEKAEEGFRWKANLRVIKNSILDVFKAQKEFFEGDVLFIYGTRSFFKILEDKDFIMEKFPKATFKAVEGATHLVHKEYPKEFADFMVNFITGEDGAVKK